MVNSHRFQIALAVASSAIVLVAFSAVAFAQVKPSEVMCKKTETQAECHVRLKCRPTEELEDCQKRLLSCRSGESLADCEKRAAAAQDQNNAGERHDADNRGGDRNADDRGRSREDERSGRERESERDRGSRGDREREDSGGRGEQDSSDRDRGERDSADRDRGDGGERGRSRGHRGGSRGGGGHGFEANKTFGLGLELGEPTGLTGKYFVSPSGALDFGIGAIYHHYYYGDGLHLYADYLFHPVSLVSAAAFEMPLYIGGGLRYWDFDYCDMRVCTYGGSAIGIRIPVGISFDFNNVPLDIFLQLVPTIDFLRGDYYTRYGNREHFGIDLSAGIRFWFK